MATEKDREFVLFLLESTKGGKIQWEPTAEQNQFTTSLKGRYSAFIYKGPTLSNLFLKDDAGQELLSVSELDISEVENLYEFVRRKTLNVDAVLNEIIRGN